MKFRAFVAVEMDEFLKLKSFSSALRETSAPLKMVDLSNIHVTLKFLGDIEEDVITEIEKVMINSVSGIDKFTIELKGTGAFPNLNRISVIWVGMVGAEPLIDIANNIDSGLEKLGFGREKRPFRPHVTVARVKGGRHKDRLISTIQEHEDIVFGEMDVDKIILKKSVLTPKGPIYSDMATVTL